MQSSIVRLKNIPYGFYEKQLSGFFSQYGKVERVRVLRSKQGHPNGIAYVKFDNVSVAEIVAETMNGYILAEKRMKCEVLKTDKVPKCIKYGGLYARFDKPQESKIRHAKIRSDIQKTKDPKKHVQKLLKNLQLRMKKIQELGIDYTFDYKTKYNAFKETVQNNK